MQKKYIMFMIAVMIYVFSLSSAEAKTVYIKSAQTKIKEDVSVTSKVITVLDKGISLEVISEKDKFYNVKLPDGKTGWIFKFNVTDTKPEGDTSNLFAKLDSGRDVSAKEAQSGGSIRGLSKISGQYASNQGITQEHINAVKNMESFNLSKEELDRFLKEGGLGEYEKK